MSADQWEAAFAALKKDGVGAVTVMEGPIYGPPGPADRCRRAEARIADGVCVPAAGRSRRPDVVRGDQSR